MSDKDTSDGHPKQTFLISLYELLEVLLNAIIESLRVLGYYTMGY